MGRSVSVHLYYGFDFADIYDLFEMDDETYEYKNTPDWFDEDEGFAESLYNALDEKLTVYPPQPEKPEDRNREYYLLRSEAERRRGLEVLHNGWFEAEIYAALSAKTFSEGELPPDFAVYVTGWRVPEMDARLWNAVKVLQIPVGDQVPAWHLDYNFG